MSFQSAIASHVSSEFAGLTASDLARDRDIAAAYLAERRVDADKLVSQGVTTLPYCQVIGISKSETYVMHGGKTVHCAGGLCAVAYILRTFW